MQLELNLIFICFKRIRQFYRSERGKNQDQYIRQFYRKERGKNENQYIRQFCKSEEG